MGTGAKRINWSEVPGGLVALGFYGMVAWIIGAAIWSSVTADDPQPASAHYVPAQAEPALAVPAVEFRLTAVGCADGWASPSIGRPGACSWHGGVVQTFRGSDGSELRCPTDTHPPDATQQAEQVERTGSLYCTSLC